MVDPGIINYVTRLRAEGQSDDSIRTSLLGAGWQESDIDEALEAASLPVQEDIVVEEGESVYESDGIPTIVPKIIIGGVIVVLAVLFFVHLRDKKEMRLSLATDFTCAMIEVGGQYENVPEYNPETTTVAEINSVLKPLIDKMDYLQAKYRLTDDELSVELEKLKPMMKDPDFNIEVQHRIKQKIAKGECF